MLDKDKIILICYIDVSEIDDSYTLEYLNRFNESLIFDESVLKLIIPNHEETRIECINPKLISDEEYAKVSELVANAQYMLNEFLNNTKNDGK